MAGVLSIAPLVAGFIALFLGTLTLTVPGERLRGRTYFVLFCLSGGGWAFAHFVLLNVLVSPASASSSYSSDLFWLRAITLLGIGGVPTYWFLFAAATAGRDRWLETRRVVLSHIPFAYLLIAALSNPLHHLYLTGDGAGGGTRYGPLAFLHVAMVIPLVLLGLYWLIDSRWNSETAYSRHRAVALGVTTVVLVTGGLHFLMSTPAEEAPADLAPSLFAILAVGLAFELAEHSIGASQPGHVARQAVEPDGLAEVDRDGTIRSMNPVASRLFPNAEIGGALADVAPEIARHTDFCMNYLCDDLTFEVVLDGTRFLARVTRSRDDARRTTGCTVRLTNVETVNRLATERERTGSARYSGP